MAGIRQFPGSVRAKKTTAWETEFVVNGTSIPDVDFDVGQSFAGSLPVGDANDGASMFFWFFPTAADDAPKEIVIWLNGGVSSPSCSLHNHPLLSFVKFVP